MRTGGEVERYAEGGLLEGIAESVSRNQQMLDTVSQNMGKMNSNIMQPRPSMPIQQPFNPILTDMEYRRPLNGFGGSPFNTGSVMGGQPLGFGGKGPQRPGRNTYGRPDSTMAGLGAFADIFNKKSPAVEPQARAEGGVIRAQSGYRGVGKGGSDTRGDSFRAPSDPTISDDFEQTGNVDVGGIFGFGQEDARTLQEILKSGPKTMEELEILEQSEIQAEKQSPLVVEQGSEENIVPSPKLNLTSGDENKTLSIEEELLKRQAGLDKSRNFDKYMALAQAGLGILASEKPTLAGAIGEGGMQGLDAFNAANKRYEEGITDILNARSKIQQARIAAGAKGKLTRSGAIQALNSFSTSISSKEKLISDIMKDSYNSPSDEQKNEIAALRESIKDLEFQKSQLFGEAKIRPRPSINVGKLPSTQKAS